MAIVRTDGYKGHSAVLKVGLKLSPSRHTTSISSHIFQTNQQSTLQRIPKKSPVSSSPSNIRVVQISRPIVVDRPVYSIDDPPVRPQHIANYYPPSTINMCDLEEFLFACGHNTFRLKAYCHFARNDPNHQCFGVKQLRDSWAQVYECDNCRLHHQQQAHQVTYGHHQGTSTSSRSGGSYRH